MNHTTQTKQARHTPGPWKVAGDEIEPIITADIIVPANELRSKPMTRTEVIAQLIGIEDNEMKANARLITAAPDLLAALEELVGSIESDPKHTRCSIPVVNEARKAAIEKAIAALSKARGQ